MLRSLKLRAERTSPTVLWVVGQYRIEQMPKLRHSTRRVTELWLKKYRVGSLGTGKPITDLQPRRPCRIVAGVAAACAEDARAICRSCSTASLTTRCGVVRFL